MIRRSVGMAVLLLALVLATGLAVRALLDTGTPTTVAATPQVADTSATRSIAVSGQGSVAITPDLAHATFGVATTGTSLAAAQSENATRMTAVLARLKGLGIAEKDLQTTGYTVAPQYDRDGAPSGYQVTNAVRATVRDIATLGATIDAAVGAGANRITGITFDLADQERARQQAREAAVADALARAQQYARLTGVVLGAPLTIVEGAGTAGFDAAVPVAAGAGGAASSTPIEAGEGAITVRVEIRYAIR